MYKKADLVSKQFISIVILIISFGIILLIWAQFNFEGNIDRDTCHTSVILRKTLPDKPFLENSKIVEIPLKCQTERICFTSGLLDSGCENIGKKYTKIKVSSEDDIIKSIAENMASCWGMMGESKDGMVFSREIINVGGSSSGVICTIFDFSPDVQKQIANFNSAKLNYFLNNNKIPERDITYSQYLANSPVPPEFILSDDVLNGKKINLNEPLAIVFVEYRESLLSKKLGLTSGAVLAGAIYGSVIPGAGTVVGASVGLVVSVAGGLVAQDLLGKWEDFLGKNKQDYYSSQYLISYNADELQKLDIDTFESLS